MYLDAVGFDTGSTAWERIKQIILAGSPRWSRERYGARYGAQRRWRALELRYLRGYTLAQIGAELGVTGTRAQELIGSSLRFLANHRWYEFLSATAQELDDTTIEQSREP